MNNNNNWCHYSDIPSPQSYNDNKSDDNNTKQYEHIELRDINSNYIKDIFKFFCYEYTQMYKDHNKIKQSIEKQIETRFNNLIINSKVNINEQSISEKRDITIHNIINNDEKRYPIKIELLYQQSGTLEIEYLYFIIK
jgi:hypothetical protein